MHTYEVLRQLPQHRALEILAEWEMFDRFGVNADHVWADEWGKAVASVTRLHTNARFHPRANEGQVRYAIWRRARNEPREGGLVFLCPYQCEEHAFPVDEKGGLIAYV